MLEEKGEGERRERERKRGVEGRALAKKRDADTGSTGKDARRWERRKPTGRCTVQVRIGRNHTRE